MKNQKREGKMCPWSGSCSFQGLVPPASPTKADKVESLVELADKCRFSLEIHGPYFTNEYCIHLFQHGTSQKVFMAKEYAAAEAQARWFLEGLSDKEGR